MWTIFFLFLYLIALKIGLWLSRQLSATTVEFLTWSGLVFCELTFSMLTSHLPQWHHWSGGSLFNKRGEGKGSGGYSVTFMNIRVEDPRPTLQHFKILMQGQLIILLWERL